MIPPEVIHDPNETEVNAIVAQHRNLPLVIKKRNRIAVIGTRDREKENFEYLEKVPKALGYTTKITRQSAFHACAYLGLRVV